MSLFPESFNTEKLLFIPAVILTIIAVTVLIALSPGSDKNPDDLTRMEDLEKISSAVRLYADANKGIYPMSLDVLVANKFLARPYADPVTAAPYRYLLTDGQSFSVCATISDGSNRCISSKAN